VSSSLRQGALSLAAFVGMAIALSGCADSVGGFFGGGKAAAAAAVVKPDPAAAAPLTKPTANSSIPVLVNDVPITDYDVAQRVRLEKLGGGKTGGTKAVTEELIDETLEMLEAARHGVSIPNAQVDAAFASIAQRLKLSAAGMTKALASQGVDAATLKKRIAVQITWQTLVKQRVQSKAQVTAQDLSAAVAAKGGADGVKVSEYTLQQIIFVVPKGSPPADYARRRNEAQAYRPRFAGCDKSLDQAKLLRGVVVKDMGRHQSTELTGPDGEAVLKTPVGEAGAPTQTEQGIQLIAVCATRDIHNADAARAEAENDLYGKQATGLGADYLKELRDRAIIEYR
jgi:peptidyl-prolyl cis-trans isomerase SurA